METQTKFYSGTAITFADMEAANGLAEKVWELSDLAYTFDDLLWNIRNQQDMLGIDATKAAMTNLVDEYTNRMALVAQVVTAKTIVKQKGSTAILADEGGQHYFYGIYTNAFWDREQEVLTAESHKEYLGWLDANPEQAPQLWTFHEESTARKEVASWWDYSDNYVQMLWPISAAEVKGISDFMDAYTPGMSHGFHVLKQTGGKVQQYRTFEVSILPLEYAANPYTSFYHLEEKIMTDEKYNVLVATHGKEFADVARSQSSKMTALTDDLEAVEKSFTAAKEAEEMEEEVTDETEVSEETETETEAPAAEEESAEETVEGSPSPEIAALTKSLASLADTVGMGFKSLQDMILEQQGQIIEMQEKNVAIAQKQQNFNDGLSKSRVTAKLLGSSKSAVGSEGNRIMSTDPLSRKGPKVEKEVSNGILGHMPK